MLVGKSKQLWEHTTSLIVTLLNVNRDPKAKPFTFEQLYPFSEKKREPEKVHDMSELKSLWKKVGK